MSITDDELIKGCKRQNRNVQEILYQKYSKGMLAVASRYVRLDQEAEDIVQEAFVKVFRSIGKFRRDSKLSYWIKRIVVNTALNHQRSKLYLYPMVDVYDLHDQSEDANALDDLSYEELLNMVQELPDGCRIIFNLYAIEGFKHHEIAKMLEISEGTSKSQYSRSKVLLQEKVLKKSKIKFGHA